MASLTLIYVKLNLDDDINFIKAVLEFQWISCRGIIWKNGTRVVSIQETSAYLEEIGPVHRDQRIYSGRIGWTQASINDVLLL